jgi:hypothetical protein
MQSLSAAEIRQLTHLGPYTMQDGQLYANTFEPKFMAVGVLKEARSDLAKVYLSEIANSSSVDPLIRKVAAFHATEQGSTLRP